MVVTSPLSSSIRLNSSKEREISCSVGPVRPPVGSVGGKEAGKIKSSTVTATLVVMWEMGVSKVRCLLFSTCLVLGGGPGLVPPGYCLWCKLKSAEAERMMSTSSSNGLSKRVHGFFGMLSRAVIVVIVFL